MQTLFCIACPVRDRTGLLSTQFLSAITLHLRTIFSYSVIGHGFRMAAYQAIFWVQISSFNPCEKQLLR